MRERRCASLPISAGLSSNLGAVLSALLGVVGPDLLGLQSGAVGSGLALPLLAPQILWTNLANRWRWGSVVLAAGLQVAVVHQPFLKRAFGTVPLSAQQWLLCLVMASGVLWLSEHRKWALCATA